MRITKLETFHVRPRWLFLKVHTDAGIVGLGEPILESRAKTVEAAVHELGRVIVGQDPRRVEHLYQVMTKSTFYRVGPILTSAISGVEQALWDILGKHLNVPVHQLLGGAVRDKIRVYPHVRVDPAHSDFAAELKRIMTTPGEYTAYKFGPNLASRFIESQAVLEEAAARVAAIRELLGPRIDLALDFHGRLSPANSRRFARMVEPYFPMFIEEPVLPGDTRALRDIATSTPIPVATGERLFTRAQFQDVIEQEAVAVVQPDLSHCGGIFEGRKIAAMAETRNIAVAPHCPLGPICFAASLQLAACTPNFLIQEMVTRGEDYLKTPFEVRDGYIPVPTGPGLGIELDEEKLKAGIWEGTWDSPAWHLEDGSRAEW